MMIAYSIIMFVVAALFLVLGVAVYRGNTKLIHDYHQANVKATEREEYGRAFAMGMFALCVTLLASGILALLDRGSVSLLVFFSGLIVSIAVFVRAQKKYNGGIF